MRKQFKAAFRGKKLSGPMGALPNEFLAGIAPDKIARVTRDVTDAFSEFADVSGRGASPRRLENELGQILGRDDITVSMYGLGRMGNAYLIQTDNFKYILKTFNRASLKSQYHGATREIPKLLLANYLNPAGASPKLFLANADDQNGFILTKFISPDTHSKSYNGMFKRLVVPISAWDTIANKERDNVISGVVIDFGLAEFHKYLATNDVAKQIAYDIANALDANDTARVRELIKKYAANPEYRRVLEYFSDILRELFHNGFLSRDELNDKEYEKIASNFPIDGIAALGIGLTADATTQSRDYSLVSLKNIYDNSDMFPIDPSVAISIWMQKNPWISTDEKNKLRVAQFGAKVGLTTLELLKLGFGRNIVDMATNPEKYQEKMAELTGESDLVDAVITNKLQSMKKMLN